MNRRRTQKRKDMVNDDERKAKDRRSLFLIDGHHIISGWPGWSVGPTTGKREERGLWRYDHCNARIPWNSETLCGHAEGTRRVFAVFGTHVFPRRHQLAYAGLVTLRNELFRSSFAALFDALSSHTFVLATIAVVVAATPKLLRVVIGA